MGKCKMKNERNRDICKGTLDIEFERDWSFGLGATLGEIHTDFFFFFSFSDFSGKAKSVIHLDFLQEQRTINAEYYSNILLGEVKDKIRSKKTTGGTRISFLQDNVRPHTATKTMETIRKLKWDLLPHPPYSDFFYLGDLKVTWRECSLRVITQ